jgi:hypothetical protein
MPCTGAILTSATHAQKGPPMLFWLLAVLIIPVITVLALVFSAFSDIWSILTLKIDVTRFFGDLWHVLLILLLGAVFEVIAIFEFLRHLI